MSELSPKRLKFIAEYLKDRNGTRAVIRAGYSERGARTTATRLLANADVKAKIDEYLAEVAAEAKIDAAWVLDNLLNVARRCQQAEPVMVRNADGEMVESGEFRFDSAGANRALELISRHTGGFDPKQKIEHTGFIETAEQKELEAYLRGQGINPEDIQERVLQ